MRAELLDSKARRLDLNRTLVHHEAEQGNSPEQFQELEDLQRRRDDLKIELARREFRVEELERDYQKAEASTLEEAKRQSSSLKEAKSQYEATKLEVSEAEKSCQVLEGVILPPQDGPNPVQDQISILRSELDEVHRQQDTIRERLADAETKGLQMSSENLAALEKLHL